MPLRLTDCVAEGIAQPARRVPPSGIFSKSAGCSPDWQAVIRGLPGRLGPRRRDVAACRPRVSEQILLGVARLVAVDGWGAMGIASNAARTLRRNLNRSAPDTRRPAVSDSAARGLRAVGYRRHPGRGEASTAPAATQALRAVRAGQGRLGMVLGAGDATHLSSVEMVEGSAMKSSC